MGVNYTGLQIGIAKAKKRVNRAWFTRECDYERQLKTARKTGKPCSCWCCGGKRKIEGDTIQERKWHEREREWL
jgi:hypothetical protein